MPNTFPHVDKLAFIFEEIFKIMWLNLQHLSTTLLTVQFGIIDRLVECMMKYVCMLLMDELKKKKLALLLENILQTFLLRK